MMKYNVSQDYETVNTYEILDAGQLSNELYNYLEENQAFFGLDVLPLQEEILAALESMEDGDLGFYGDITVFASEAPASEAFLQNND